MTEKMRILIAYDGSECADAAIDDLPLAGLPADSVEALVISVAEIWLPPTAPTGFETAGEPDEEPQIPIDLQKVYAKKSMAMEETRLLAERARERLQRHFPEWKASAEASYGSPAWEIISKADSWKPHLIVVGSQGRTALGRFVLGSVSQKVLTEARSSVRLARGRVEVEPSPVRVLVGVDGSQGSVLATRSVAARAWPEGTEARVVVAEDPLMPAAVGRVVPPLARWIEGTNQDEMQWVQKAADEAVDELRVAGLMVSSTIQEGDPKSVLVEEAKSWGADSIFVGSTGFSSRFSRFLLGSVSAAVAARAHCSVEVVRPQQIEA